MAGFHHTVSTATYFFGNGVLEDIHLSPFVTFSVGFCSFPMTFAFGLSVLSTFMVRRKLFFF